MKAIKATIVDYPQGSEAWKRHRAKALNASELAAAMGISKYKTRAQLIAEKATGIVPEVDAETQRRFDKGHEYEAGARPLVEEDTGEALYPCVLAAEVDGLLLSASLDGMDLMQELTWEHKTASAALIASLEAGVIPDEYHPQMEQGLMLSGASRCKFSASKGTRETLVSVWYESNPELRAKVIPTWKQFMADVAAYTPTEAAEPAKAEAMESLPAVSVRLDGALSVAGNLPTFAEALKAFIAKIPTKPATDNEFATVDAACKALKKAEETLDSAEANALASITDVEAMRRAVADCRKLARDTRLAAEKLVERRKVEMKEQAVMAARRALQEHVDALSAELAPIRVQMPAVDFPLAIKGLRSIASMQDALDTELATGKIAADAQARVIRANRDVMEKNDAHGLFPDFQHVCTKPADDFANLLANRRAATQAQLDAERERIRAQEVARLEREAAARAAAEAQARADEAARLEREQREEAERQARELKVARERAEEAEARQMVREAVTTAEAIGLQTPNIARTATEPLPAPAPEVRAFPAPAAELPTMTLGALNARLGFTVSADFLESLGFVAHREKSARLYRPSQFPAICAGISAHVLAVAAEQKRAA